MEILDKLEELIRDIYYPLIVANVNTTDTILRRIMQTTTNCYGKNIIVYDSDLGIEKSYALENITVGMRFSSKALQGCQYNLDAMQYLLSNESEMMCAKLICDMRELLQKRICQELGVEINDYTLTHIFARLDDCDYEGIQLCQLCEWKFIPDKNGRIVRETKNDALCFYDVTIVKYCNFIFSSRVLNKIRNLLYI